MVWYLDGPRTVVSRIASRCAAHTQRIDGWIIFIQHSLFSTNGTDSFQNHRDPYSLDEPNHIPSKSIRPVFCLNRLRTVPTTAYIRHFKTQSDWFSYPTTHPFFIAPRPLLFFGGNFSNTFHAVFALTIHTRLRPPRKYWNSAFSTFFKKLVSDDLLGMSVICRPDRLAMPYFTGEFE